MDAARIRLRFPRSKDRLLVRHNNTVAENSAANPSLWKKCLLALESSLPEQDFNMWIRPLQAVESDIMGNAAEPAQSDFTGDQPDCREPVNRDDAGGAIDELGHGSSVAAVIAAFVAEAAIVSLRVFEREGICDFAAVMHALRVTFPSYMPKIQLRSHLPSLNSGPVRSTR